MKCLNIWFASILILSALLLNGVRSAYADPNQLPSPQAANPTKSVNGQTASQENQTPSPERTLATEQRQHGSTTQNNSDDRQSESRAEALNAALIAYTGKLARYTELLVVIGFLQVLVAFIQVGTFIWSVQEQVRPRIKVRALTMVNDLKTVPHDKAPFRFSILLCNQGASAAKIISGNFTVMISRNTTTPSFGYGEPAYRPPFDWLEGEVIPAGPDSPFSYEMDRSLSFPEIQDLLNQRTFLYVYGHIFYRSRWSIPRRPYRTAFCRKYDTGIEELVITPSGSMFEFAD